MLPRILHNSDQLISFFNDLGLELMLPRASNVADFFRMTPWQAGNVRDALRQYWVSGLSAKRNE
jgi:hypothetical protein